VTLADDTLVVKDLLAAMFESALGKTGTGDPNARAEAVIAGFFPGAFSGVVLTKQFTLNANSYAAGQGTGADTNGTARRYHLGTALPAGAIVIGHMIHVVTANTVNTTLSAAIGTITPTDDFDTMVTAQDLQATAGYYAGTLGDAPDSSTLNGQQFYGGGQLTITVTPDNGSKVSAADGSAVVSVFYMDAT